jgi:acetyltransferase-like isoleucine patch superfamily enzyme
MSDPLRPVRVLLAARNHARALYKTWIFKRACLLGEDVAVGPDASCSNGTGDVGRLCVSAHATIHGVLICGPDGRIAVGRHSYIGGRTLVESMIGVCIGDDVAISHDCYLIDSNSHPTSPAIRRSTLREFAKTRRNVERPAETGCAPIEIESNVWIGFNSIILKGVTVGRGSIVACGSVVTSNVPPFSIAAGNPARVVKTLTNDLD